MLDLIVGLALGFFFGVYAGLTIFQYLYKKEFKNNAAVTK